MKTLNRKRTFLSLLFFASIFAGLFFFAYKMIASAPPVECLASLFIRAVPNTTIRLGYEELGQRTAYNSAERSHIALQYRDNGWWISNIATQKKLLVKKGEEEYLLKRIPLLQGDRFLLGGSTVTVQTITQKTITLASTANTAQWDMEKRQLTVSGLQYSPDDSDKGTPNAGENEKGCFYLGGSLSLDNQWGIADTLPRSLKIVYRDGIFYLAPARTNEVVLFRANKSGTTDRSNPQTFHNQWFYLGDTNNMAQWLIAGRTPYIIFAEQEGIRLLPSSKQMLFPAGEKSWLHTALFDQYGKPLSWAGDGASLVHWLLGDRSSRGSWPFFLTAFFLFIIFFTVIIRNLLHNFARYKLPIASNALLLLIPLCASLSFGLRPTLVLPLLICWLSFLWATVMLWLQGRLNGISGRIWGCVILLAATGVFTLLQLCAGSLNTGWIVYVQRQLTHLTLFALFVGIFCCMSVSALRGIAESISLNPNRLRLLPILQFLVIVSASALLVASGLWGSEGGLGWVQPSELLKFLFPLQAALIMPRLLLIRRSRALTLLEQRKAMRWVLIQVLILIFVGGGIFLIKHDFSPVVILSFYLIFCYWQLISFRLMSVYHALFFAVILLVITFIAFDIYHNPNRTFWKNHIPQHERILVWSEPSAAPHSGAQVIHSMELIAKGSWKGAASSWFGNNNRGNALPAVQDDFIGAFLFYRFGGIAGGGLMMLQIFTLYFLLRADNLLYKDGFDKKKREGELVEREVSIFFSFLLRSLVFILSLQWIISWGNCLGILPVMGQPMTWLSSGNSHLWAVGFSVVLLSFWIIWWRSESQKAEDRNQEGSRE